MSPPVPSLDQGSSALLWALWHNVDPTELLLQSRDVDRATTSMSVQSYESPYKHTPSFAFPSRKSQYAEVIRVRAKQNAARTRYCSTAPLPHSISEEEEDMVVQAKPSTLCESSPRVKQYHSDTFLTEMPEFYAIEPYTENITKICMPAFLPTIQAKTQTKGSSEKQSSVVRKYLQKNDLTNSSAPTTPYTTQSLPLDLDSTKLSHLIELEKSVLIHDPVRAKTQKSKKRKASRYRTRYRPTGNKSKKVGKIYFGKDRELSSTGASPSKTNHNTTSSTSMSYHSFITPQDELITHFSRISMRQVQATINNSRLAILPHIS